MPTLVFCHGKESGPAGTKINHLRPLGDRYGFRVEAPDFRGMDDPEERVRHLLSVASDWPGPLVLAGSSMGGYVAIRASQALRPAGLLLMAPAVGLPGYAERAPKPEAGCVRVVHGWRDEIIPAQIVVDWCCGHRIDLRLVDDAHALKNSLEALSEALEDILTRMRTFRPEGG